MDKNKKHQLKGAFAKHDKDKALKSPRGLFEILFYQLAFVSSKLHIFQKKTHVVCDAINTWTWTNVNSFLKTKDFIYFVYCILNKICLVWRNVEKRFRVGKLFFFFLPPFLWFYFVSVKKMIIFYITINTILIFEMLRFMSLFEQFIFLR